MNNIVILISGAGSNMAAILRTAEQQNWKDTLNARVSLVLSNKADAGGLAWARSRGIVTASVEHTLFATRAEFDAEMMRHIDAHQPVLVVLAGFMRILTPEFVAHYAGKLINIHPSLLPAFRGMHTHQRAIDAGCRFTGASVHQVTEELDAGAILAQAVVPILPDDTARSLAQRVQSQEYVIYPEAIATFLRYKS